MKHPLLKALREAGARRSVAGCVGLSGPEYDYCEFIGTWRPSEAARQIQELLRSKGATSLKADGLWGGCTESAFQKIFGEPLTQDSLQRLLGVTCKAFKKGQFGACTNGSDVITEVIQPEVVVGPTPTAYPDQPVSFFKLKAPLTVQTSQQRLVQGITQEGIQRVQAAEAARVAAETAAAVAAQQTVPGVPNWALAAGLFVAVVGGAYYMKKRRANASAA